MQSARAETVGRISEGIKIGAIGNYLIDHGLLDIQEVVQIENQGSESKKTFAQAAKDVGVVPTHIKPEKLYEAIATVYEYKFLDKIEEDEVDSETLSEFTVQKATELGCIFLKGNRVVISEPSSWHNIESLLSDNYWEILVSTPSEIRNNLSSANLQSKEIKSEVSLSDEGINDLYNRIITDATTSKATDVHFEPQKDKSGRIRLRVDGVLIEEHGKTLNKDNFDKLTNIILSTAQMDAGGTSNGFRDGQIAWVSPNGNNLEVDIRVSKIDTNHGKSLVLRLLVKDEQFQTLETLRYSEKEEEQIRRIAMAPYGLLFMTGPTGSGKTTTLYAIVRMLSSVANKIVSCEDPIEQDIPGVQQVEYKKVGTQEENWVTFDKAIKAFLRQDPDIMLIGEIRDPQTAKASIQAAQTGHLVLSTVHANSAVEVASRLAGLGVSRELLASLVEGIVSQRLVRRLCTNCMEVIPTSESENTPKVLKDYLIGRGIDQLPKSVGCEKCRDTGFRGRHVLCEILEMNPIVRDILEKNENTYAIEKQLIENGFVPMAEKGIMLIEKHITTLEEIQRVENIVQYANFMEMIRKKKKEDK
jgi:type IV pilus assembly protein PilB